MDESNRHYLYGRRVLDMVSRALIGKQHIILRVFLAILARGHILLEDIPGVGKTTLALAFSKALSLDYGRVQFTPDVLPSDVTGFSVYNKQTGSMDYVPGAVMCNLFLADELNRATSRTQSALLEAMEEGQVTVDGVSHELEEPFTVIATQNPVGAAGTQLLPDSQLDRFMLRLSIGYPGHEDEVSLLKRKQGPPLLDAVEPVLSKNGLEQMRAEVDMVHVDAEIMNYIVSLVTVTRNHPDILQGASPRASIALAGVSKALAYMQGRDYVTPKDISPLFADILSHRMILKPGVESSGVKPAAVLTDILKSVTPPRIK